MPFTTAIPIMVVHHKLLEDAAFLSGFNKIETTVVNGVSQKPMATPKLILHYIQDRYIKPDIVIDINCLLESENGKCKGA